jgi:hypothetical protein
MRVKGYREARIDLESGGVVHLRAKFNMLRLTANDRIVMSAIADAVQRGDAHRLLKYVTEHCPSRSAPGQDWPGFRRVSAVNCSGTEKNR